MKQLGFAWQVDTGGYRIAEVEGDGGALVRAVLWEEDRLGTRTRRYLLQEEDRVLYARFASLDASEASILKFARRFGPLGVWRRPQRAYVPPAILWEPLAEWEKRIRRLDYAFRLWEAIRDRDVDTAQELLDQPLQPDHAEEGAAFEEWIRSWRNPTAWHAPTLSPEGLLTHTYRPNSPEARAGDRAGKLAASDALAALQWHVNLNMDARACLAIDGERSKRSQGELCLSLVLAPHNLLGAMWMQLAAAIDSNAPPRRCAYSGCDQWFVPRRSDARYHSKNCWNLAKYHGEVQPKGGQK